MEYDCSPRLAFFISKINPKKSFENLSMLYDFSFEEIKYYATHLIKWQNAVIINPISNCSSFTINPNYNINKPLNLDVKDSIRMDTLSLLKKSEYPFEVNSNDNDKTETGTIIRLLQIEFLKEANRYIYMKMNEKDNLDAILYPKSLPDKDQKIYKILKTYSMKNVHIFEIAWRENINVKEIVSGLQTFSQMFGSYYI